MVKVAIIGDSFGLPRFYKHQQEEIETPFEDTYPELLRRLLLEQNIWPDVALLNFSILFNTTLTLLKDSYAKMKLYQPDYIVIQLGLVDCWDRTGADNVPVMYPELAGKNPWVSEAEFVSHLVTFVNACLQTVHSVKGIVIATIPKVMQWQYDKHSGSDERTVAYNSRLRALAQIPRVSIADIYGRIEALGDAAFITDGVHPTRASGMAIASEILDRMKELHLEVLEEIKGPVDRERSSAGMGQSIGNEQRGGFDPAADLALGIGHFKAGQLESAVEAFTRLVQSENGSLVAEAHYYLGLCAERGRDLHAAVQSYCQALRLTPDYAEAFVALFSLLAAHDTRDAVSRFYQQNFADTPQNRLMIEEIYRQMKR